jgi:hypothetical protein
MNQHEKTSELLVAYALGDLSARGQAAVESHVARCPKCSDELKRVRALLNCTERIGEWSADPEVCKSAVQAVLGAARDRPFQQTSTWRIIRPEFTWRITVSNRRMKLAGIAAIVMVVLGGVTFWPFGSAGSGRWWLGPPAVWAQEIVGAMGNIEALVYRKQAVFVRRHGHTHVSGSWSKIYKTRDRSRTDQYYEDTDENTTKDNSSDSILVQTTWEVPDGNDLMSYNVSFEHECYTIKTRSGGAYKRDPMLKLRSHVKELERADRILETEVFEGRECVGFEVGRDHDGDDAGRRVDRIWFDVETKLPVRVERHGIGVTDSPAETMTFIDDRFEYYAQIPAGLFEPKIPENFIEAEPADIHAAKELQEKGEMPYADVPHGLRDEVVAALDDVKTVIYRTRSGLTTDGNWIYSGGRRWYVSPHAWREDVQSGEQMLKSDYFVVDKGDWGRTSLDFNDKRFKLKQTTLNFAESTYTVVIHGSESHPDNPLDRIVRIASLLNEADLFWEGQEVDGVHCFGFEISAKKYGTNPDGMVHRVWFDAQTRLPVRMEFEYLHKGDGKPRRSVTDRFQWNAEIPATTFEPMTPEGFVSAHPDGIQVAGERQLRE